ncbi:hypothetical protein FHR81_000799 [Actinoalloteichus hoggarensis]|uniref:Uncharacterized protein n=1 Tax=Actinoalloteichus hoggarensis TaxID=1470176 RepID=A0A221W1A5_9PSEU|nr:hypothetical protein [Actinoalloteichus hoggarensis]ASO19523.1 hypothetical protein AHOG_09395 [Actinoalloteichus hoggarensis]MBB5919770.1 hypothetical protein [Actinoalloteichus hoggarensis]
MTTTPPHRPRRTEPAGPPAVGSRLSRLLWRLRRIGRRSGSATSWGGRASAAPAQSPPPPTGRGPQARREPVRARASAGRVPRARAAARVRPFVLVGRLRVVEP